MEEQKNNIQQLQPQNIQQKQTNEEHFNKKFASDQQQKIISLLKNDPNNNDDQENSLNSYISLIIKFWEYLLSTYKTEINFKQFLTNQKENLQSIIQQLQEIISAIENQKEQNKQFLNKFSKKCTYIIDKFNNLSMEQDMNQIKKIQEFVFNEFDNNVLESLKNYIRIPNLSQAYDPEWNTNGLLDKAATHLLNWAISQNLANSEFRILREDMKAPLIFGEVKNTLNTNDKEKTILFYGHYDKQPHFDGWYEGLGPTLPVVKDDNLYGRGAADDGYSIYATVLAIKACQKNFIHHPRIIILIEGAEESSSKNFLYYLDKLQDQIGSPDLLISNETSTGNYDTLWNTISLRGNIKADLTVQVLTQGLHSGPTSGVVPDSFRILRKLLDRIENSETGEIIKDFTVEIPQERYEQACITAQTLGANVYLEYPFVGNMKPTTEDVLEAYLNKTWRPQLSIIGAGGIPNNKDASNVLRPETTLTLSLRLPPTYDSEKGAQILKSILEKDAPYNSNVKCDIISYTYGWNAPLLEPYLKSALNESSFNYFKDRTKQISEGGSVPLMNTLQKRWPKMQTIVTGVLGPGSNAHGPNENLQLTYTKKLICCLTQIVFEQFKNYTLNNEN